MASDLEVESLRRFDELVESGDIIFQDTTPILVPSKPFNFQFRIADSLTKKPQIDINVARKLQEQSESKEPSPADAPSSSSSSSSSARQATPPEKAKSEKPKSPFDRDPPSFVLSHPTDTHTLRFNKFCVVRPQFVLHTDEWQSQINPLETIDIEAGWTTLKEFGEGYMLIFNGGTQGGWSLPHRHMQLLPLSTGKPFGYDLWPDIYASKKLHEGMCNGSTNNSPSPFAANKYADGIITVPEIPYAHALHKLPANPFQITPSTLHDIYASLLKVCNVGESNEFSHNLILTHCWMLVIPRLRAAQPGINVINASAMVGMVWIPSQEVWQAWQDYKDMMATMTRFGYPNK
ncbi:hypothetical protein KEM56_001022 [Ascosphaera pollenicola]|nr:hypothetical protein KEM56_001022 [Ascosphaera pollenicola]